MVYGPGASGKALELVVIVSVVWTDAALVLEASRLPRTLSRLLISWLAAALDALDALAALSALGTLEALEAMDEARISDCGAAEGGMIGAPVMVFTINAGW